MPGDDFIVGAESVALRDAVRRVVATRPRRLCLIVTAALGVVGATTAFGDDATMSDASTSAQLLMSITLPFLGVLLAGDRRAVRSTGRRRVWSSLLTAGALAIAVAVLGAVLAVAAAGASGAKTDTPLLAVIGGGVAVQFTAQAVGTASGLLVTRRWMALAATVVVPLGVFAVASVLSVADWIAPVAAARGVLGDDVGAADWGRWALVFAIWGIAPNLVGLYRVAR